MYVIVLYTYFIFILFFCFVCFFHFLRVIKFLFDFSAKAKKVYLFLRSSFSFKRMVSLFIYIMINHFVFRLSEMRVLMVSLWLTYGKTLFPFCENRRNKQTNKQTKYQRTIIVFSFIISILYVYVYFLNSNMRKNNNNDKNAWN